MNLLFVNLLNRFLFTGPLYRALDRDACLAQLKSYIEANQISSYPLEIDPEEIGVEQAKQIILFMVCWLLFISFHLISIYNV